MANITDTKGNAAIIRNYIFLFFLIAQSSIPLFIGNTYLIIFFSITFVIFLVQKQIFSKFIFNYLIVFLAIFTVQSLWYGVIEFSIIFGFVIRILWAYCTIKIIGKNVDLVYVNILYFFSIISILFFTAIVLSPGFESFLNNNVVPFFKNLELYDSRRSHIGIYTVNSEVRYATGLYRNSGPFWEPGGFGVFLIIAIIFNTLREQSLFNKKNIVFLIACITTFSTGTYINLAMFLALLMFYNFYYRRKIYIIFILPVLFIVSFFLYNNLFFLREKVDKNVEPAESYDLSDAPRTRVVSAKLDIIDFLNNPLIGRGRYRETRFEKWEDADANHRTNGVTAFLVEFGLIGFVFYFYTMLRSFKKYSRSFGSKKFIYMAFLMVVLIAGSSQSIFGKPFFIGLSFMFLCSHVSINFVRNAQNIAT